MSGFDGEHKIPVFDALTVIVMLEKCEPELTVVTFWDTSGRDFIYRGKNYAQPPREYTWCMQCLLARHSPRRVEDGRAAVLNLVKLGKLHIVSIGPRSDTFRCPRCHVARITIP